MHKRCKESRFIIQSIFIIYATVSIRLAHLSFQSFSFVFKRIQHQLQSPRRLAKKIKCQFTYPWASQLVGWFFCGLLRHVSIEDDFCTWSLFVIIKKNHFSNFSLGYVQQYKNCFSFSNTSTVYTLKVPQNVHCGDIWFDIKSSL